MENKKVKDENHTEWLELCEYVHKEILQYDEKMKLPKYIILRLRGLSKGQFMANKKQKPQASYDYKTILYTFKICKTRILQHIIGNKTKFNGEQHKFNSIMIFIENEINDVVIRLKSTKQSEEKIENLELENQFNNGADYKKKEVKTNKNLDNLW